MKICDNLKNKKAYTLIEVLIVFTIIGILAIAALTNFVSATRTFDFLDDFKAVVQSIRTARSYAVTNKDVHSDGEENMYSGRFGVQIEEQKVTVFADNIKTPYKFDPSPQDSSQADKILLMKGHDFNDTPIHLYSDDIALPLVLFYEPTSGAFSVHDTESEITLDNRCLEFRMTSDESNIERFIVIFQVSGLPEGFEQGGNCSS